MRDAVTRELAHELVLIDHMCRTENVHLRSTLSAFARCPRERVIPYTTHWLITPEPWVSPKSFTGGHIQWQPRLASSRIFKRESVLVTAPGESALRTI